MVQIQGSGPFRFGIKLTLPKRKLNFSLAVSKLRQGDRTGTIVERMQAMRILTLFLLFSCFVSNANAAWMNGDVLFDLKNDTSSEFYDLWLTTRGRFGLAYLLIHGSGNLSFVAEMTEWCAIVRQVLQNGTL